MATTQPKIIPHLWYDREAKEAAGFYTSLFPESSIRNTGMLRDTPSGDTETVSFELWGQQFMAISAGPLFKFNPSISFMVNFDPARFKPSSAPEMDARKKLDQVWDQLAQGGTVLMPLDKYPFSPRYGWVQDRFGLSWQLILTNPEGEPRPAIIPTLMFTGRNAGKAGAAIDFYLSVFRDSRQGRAMHYGLGQEPDTADMLAHADFMLENQWFAAMDSAREHGFTFNEAISFMVRCADQPEIDYCWSRLSAVPEAEQCGWLKDRYGLSWQVVPEAMDEMMRFGTGEQIDRVTRAFLKMKKFDLAELKRAYAGERG